MIRATYFLIFLASILNPAQVRGQRTYLPKSVLASGTWHKLAVGQSGLYKLEGSRLQASGLLSLPVSSSSIRLFTKGGGLLGESNAAPYVDDLREVALEVFDGGDGQFQATDYFLFYSSGPHRWQPDLPNGIFQFQKNLYTDSVYYYFTVSGVGKRVSNQPASGSGGPIVDRYLDRQVYELDSVNLLQSGKEWYGDELAQAPGKSLRKDLSFSFPNLVPGGTVRLRSRILARSTGSGSGFELTANGALVGQQTIPPIGTQLYDPFAATRTDLFSFPLNDPSLNLSIQYQPGAFGAQGWIDRVEVFAPRFLSMNGLRSLSFRDLGPAGQASVQFRIQSAPADLSVWEVTDPFEVRRLQGDRTGSDYLIQSSAPNGKEFFAFSGTDFPSPRVVGLVPNQDLHGLTATDLVIVTPMAWRAAADKLAAWHRSRTGLRVHVIYLEQVREEFGGGVNDPTAIRDLMKMFYDRHRGNLSDRPRYLLLMGAGSYDPKARIRNNDSPILTYQSPASLDPLATYCSDDYFGFLDDTEDINNTAIENLLDLGIGRIPARSLPEAMAYVDKVMTYAETASRGNWQTRISFLADDEDGNLHLSDAEGMVVATRQVAPWLNTQKIYLDAYRQQAGAAGTRYPEANAALDREIFKGNLIVNYTGHGGKEQLAQEVLVSRNQVEGWKNADRLPLFIVGTCDFAPYDNPSVRGLGERLLIKPASGGIALLSTARPVFAFSNRILHENYLRVALQPSGSGTYLSLGESIQKAKNLTYQTSSDLINNRKFSLLGDPALTLAFPQNRVQTVRINGLLVSLTDTIKAGAMVLIEGEVIDQGGQRLSGFNGWVYPTLYDKPRVQTTLANDPGSISVPVEMPGAVLFSGVSSVIDGRFQFEFTAPLDMNPVVGKGRISYYARSSTTDAQGFGEEIWVGDRTAAIAMDREGPVIQLSLNEPGFAEGGLTNSTPVLIAELTDSSGINTAGGIGHDLLATLSVQPASLNPQVYTLNDFYQSAPNTAKKGTIRYPLPELASGNYLLKLRAWDVLNNPSEKTLSFVVGDGEGLRIQRVLNYPNPFTGRTNFWFEHNAPGQMLTISVEVMTVTGRVVRTLQTQASPEGSFYRDLEWDGRDEQGDRLGRGTYLYRLRVRCPGKGEASELGKLVIL
ncbi:MAG: type IX secretion system sortase PorU [Bacteroidetes bacterium]|nr:type IX secretion system sortase PorU [Bacteroidota bacterium]